MWIVYKLSLYGENLKCDKIIYFETYPFSFLVKTRRSNLISVLLSFTLSASICASHMMQTKTVHKCYLLLSIMVSLIGISRAEEKCDKFQMLSKTIPHFCTNFYCHIAENCIVSYNCLFNTTCHGSHHLSYLFEYREVMAAVCSQLP